MGRAKSENKAPKKYLALYNTYSYRIEYKFGTFEEIKDWIESNLYELEDIEVYEAGDRVIIIKNTTYTVKEN